MQWVLNPHLSDDIDAMAWVIECKRTRRKIWGFLHITGAESNAYRGKLLGIYALHAIVLASILVYDIEPGLGNRLFCDNEKALEMAQGTDLRSPVRVSHSDIIPVWAIRRVKHQMSGTPLDYEHIYSHQDGNVCYKKLKARHN